MTPSLDLHHIDNIIFDLGMVIINLDQSATEKAFQKLFGKEYDNLFATLSEDGFFHAYETGEISTKTFLSRLQKASTKDLTTEELAAAWNAMLLDIPPIRFDLLIWAKNNYRTFCLSNTNELHIDFIYENLKKERNLENLDLYFEKVYLSHEINLRKPNADIFQFVVNQKDLDPSRTLFIDDTLEHIQGAQAVGLKTYHLKEGIVLEELIKPK